jgi:prophage regulatory protein
MPDKILRLPQVIEQVGLRRSSIYAAMQTGAFPRSIVLGPRAVGWLERDIADWIATRASTSPSNSTPADEH